MGLGLEIKDEQSNLDQEEGGRMKIAAAPQNLGKTRSRPDICKITTQLPLMSSDNFSPLRLACLLDSLIRIVGFYYFIIINSNHIGRTQTTVISDAQHVFLFH